MLGMSGKCRPNLRILGSQCMTHFILGQRIFQNKKTAHRNYKECRVVSEIVKVGKYSTTIMLKISVGEKYLFKTADPVYIININSAYWFTTKTILLQ